MSVWIASLITAVLLNGELLRTRGSYEEVAGRSIAIDEFGDSVQVLVQLSTVAMSAAPHVVLWPS